MKQRVGANDDSGTSSFIFMWLINVKNQYAGLRVSRAAIAIDYALDMAEVPALQEITALDANRNGRPEPIETAGYASRQCDAIRSQLELRLAARPTPLALMSSAVQFPAGAGNLYTLRLTCSFEAEIGAATDTLQVDFQNKF